MQKSSRLILPDLDPETVAKHLRQWVVKKRAKVPFPIVAKELEIPLARFQKAMLGKDTLPEFTSFLAEKLGLSGAETVQTAPVTPIATADTERGRRWQELFITTINCQVFCCITSKDISARHCLAIQGQNECFGCAAPSRLCLRCRKGAVAFPEVDVCGTCLAALLADERQNGLPNFAPGTKVTCPLSRDRLITVSTCRSMQSQACALCDAPTRFCQKCREHPVRYPEYGLCLNCTTETYDPDWLANQNERLAQEAEILTGLERQLDKEYGQIRRRPKKIRPAQSESRARRRPAKTTATPTPRPNEEVAKRARVVAIILTEENLESAHLRDLLPLLAQGGQSPNPALSRLAAVLGDLNLKDKLAVAKAVDQLWEKAHFVYE